MFVVLGLIMKTGIRAAAFAVGFAMCGALGSASAASIVFFDDFEEDSYGMYANLKNWNVTDGNVDVVGGGRHFDWWKGSGLYVDMAGNLAGTIETKLAFDLVVGATYELSFDYAKYSRSTETLFFGVGDEYSNSLALGANPSDSFSFFTTTFVATGGLSRIVFGTTGPETAGVDKAGPVIDNVMLSLMGPQPDFSLSAPIGDGRSSTSVVPVPPALPLLFSALAGLAFLRRRRGAR